MRNQLQLGPGSGSA
jgi:hypothetical protein